MASHLWRLYRAHSHRGCCCILFLLAYTNKNGNVVRLIRGTADTLFSIESHAKFVTYIMFTENPMNMEHMHFYMAAKLNFIADGVCILFRSWRNRRTAILQNIHCKISLMNGSCVFMCVCVRQSVLKKRFAIPPMKFEYIHKILHQDRINSKSFLGTCIYTVCHFRSKYWWRNCC